MKNYLFKTLTLALLSVFLLTACSKKDKTKPKDASGVGTVTADLAFSSGEKVSFSYQHDKYMPSPVAVTGPDENGLYGILMSAAQTKNGKDYMLMFTGFIEKGKGTYHPKDEDKGEPQAAVIITVTDEEGSGGNSYMPYPEEAFDYTLNITEFSNHTIKGTFSGKLTTANDPENNVTITNGKFHFNKVTIQSKD